MILHIEVEVSREDLIKLRDNSLERVMTSMFEDPHKGTRIESRRELKELKGTACKLWYAASGKALTTSLPTTNH